MDLYVLAKPLSELNKYYTFQNKMLQYKGSGCEKGSRKKSIEMIAALNRETALSFNKKARYSKTLSPPAPPYC